MADLIRPTIPAVEKKKVDEQHEGHKRPLGFSDLCISCSNSAYFPIKREGRWFSVIRDQGEPKNVFSRSGTKASSRGRRYGDYDLPEMLC